MWLMSNFCSLFFCASKSSFCKLSSRFTSWNSGVPRMVSANVDFLISFAKYTVGAAVLTVPGASMYVEFVFIVWEIPLFGGWFGNESNCVSFGVSSASKSWLFTLLGFLVNTSLSFRLNFFWRVVSKPSCVFSFWSNSETSYFRLL